MGNETQKTPSPVSDNPSTIVTESEDDGKITITFLKNDYEVRGDFYPPMADGKPLSQEYVNDLLERFKIVFGIKKEEIDSALNKCLEEKRIIKDVLVAQGTLPVDTVLEYMQLNPIFKMDSAQKRKEDTVKSVDHRERSPFMIVKKGQALAKQKSAKPGKNGTNVYGESKEHSAVRPEGVSGGENTKMDGRFLVAGINGQLMLKGGVVSVNESLVIKGPVGYGTGNIIFPGDVEIEGPVSDGFKIYSSGSVTIKQTFDVTDAITKENLTVAGGIIGRGQGLVKVGGWLKTKFIENCRIACRKSIVVDSEIINSQVYTLETLTMGDKGKIVGGEIYAVKGVRTGSIGRKTGKAARIHCGVDFTLEQEKEKNNSLLGVLAAKLNRLKELMSDPQIDDEKRKKYSILKNRLEAEQQKTQAKISEILGKLNTYGDATVEVLGEIVPGTLIEICQTALFVTEPLKKVRIKLERENNRLVTEKL